MKQDIVLSSVKAYEQWKGPKWITQQFFSQERIQRQLKIIPFFYDEAAPFSQGSIQEVS